MADFLNRVSLDKLSEEVLGEDIVGAPVPSRVQVDVAEHGEHPINVSDGDGDGFMLNQDNHPSFLLENVGNINHAKEVMVSINALDTLTKNDCSRKDSGK